MFAGFTRELFLALAPAFPPSTLVRYDGNAVGDVVELRLGFGPIAQIWRSVITEHETSDKRCSFVDEGRRLPFPLTYWRHRHVVEAAGPGRVAIVEDITFATGSPGLTRFLRPLVRLQFAARRGGYTAYFGRVRQ